MTSVYDEDRKKYIPEFMFNNGITNTYKRIYDNNQMHVADSMDLYNPPKVQSR